MPLSARQVRNLQNITVEIGVLANAGCSDKESIMELNAMGVCARTLIEDCGQTSKYKMETPARSALEMHLCIASGRITEVMMKESYILEPFAKAIRHVVALAQEGTDLYDDRELAKDDLRDTALSLIVVPSPYKAIAAYH